MNIFKISEISLFCIGMKLRPFEIVHENGRGKTPHTTIVDSLVFGDVIGDVFGDVRRPKVKPLF